MLHTTLSYNYLRGIVEYLNNNQIEINQFLSEFNIVIEDMDR